MKIWFRVKEIDSDTNSVLGHIYTSKGVEELSISARDVIIQELSKYTLEDFNKFLLKVENGTINQILATDGSIEEESEEELSDPYEVSKEPQKAIMYSTLHQQVGYSGERITHRLSKSDKIEDLLNKAVELVIKNK